MTQCNNRRHTRRWCVFFPSNSTRLQYIVLTIFPISKALLVQSSSPFLMPITAAPSHSPFPQIVFDSMVSIGIGKYKFLCTRTFRFFFFFSKAPTHTCIIIFSCDRDRGRYYVEYPYWIVRVLSVRLVWWPSKCYVWVCVYEYYYIIIVYGEKKSTTRAGRRI